MDVEALLARIHSLANEIEKLTETSNSYTESVRLLQLSKDISFAAARYRLMERRDVQERMLDR